MALQKISKTTKLIYLFIFVILILIGNVRTQKLIANASNGADYDVLAPVGVLELVNKTKTVKKELRVNLTDEVMVPAATLPPESDEHTEEIIVISEKTEKETAGKAMEQEMVEKLGSKQQKGTEKTVIKISSTSSSIPPLADQPIEEEKLLISKEDDISESLMPAFYFFLALSSGAIIFILIKIYRLRLSRAERKYGVQGDRSNQELTPLPVSIEDGHSDEEDQTLFEVRRENIRIL